MKHNKNPSFTLQKCHILLGLLWCTKFPLAKEYLQKSGTKTHVLTKKEQSYEDYLFKNIAHMFIYPISLSLQNQRVEYLTILKYSNGISLCMHAKSLQLCPIFATLWTVAQQGSSVGFSTQEYWSGLLCPLPGDLTNSGIKAGSPAFPTLQADSLPSETLGQPQDFSLLISK